MGRYNGAYINISEYVHGPKWKNPVSTLLLVADSLVAVIIAFYFKIISKNWIWLQIFGITVNAVAIFGCAIIPESPEYLYSFYKFSKARDVVAYIAKFNGVKGFYDRFMFSTECEIKSLNFERRLSPTDHYHQSMVRETEHIRSIMI